MLTFLSGVFAGVVVVVALGLVVAAWSAAKKIDHISHTRGHLHD